MAQALETQKALFKLRPTIVNVLSTVCLLSLSSMPVVLAATTALGDVVSVDTMSTLDNSPLTRGEAVQRVVDYFDLKVTNAKLLQSCFLVPDECFFAFTAMSDFDGISFKPLILYPDVKSGNKYSDAINTATILGIVRGNINVDQTPFYPNHYLTRIQALKVIFGATGQLAWKEKFEMEDDYWYKQSLDKKFLISDIDPQSQEEWWYGRYGAFAISAGLIKNQESFRPNDAVTGKEMASFMQQAQNFKNQHISVTDVQTTQETQQPAVTIEQTLN